MQVNKFSKQHGIKFLKLSGMIDIFLDGWILGRMMRRKLLIFFVGTSFPHPEDSKPDEANDKDNAEDYCNKKEERH